MSRPKHWRKWYVLGALALTGVLAAARRPEPPCLAALEWAEANRVTLPTTLPKFAGYSMLYRKAIYHELSLQQRRALWREHLSSFVGPDSRLTAKQQALVRSVIGGINSYVAAPAKARDALARDGLTAKRLKAEFGDQLAREIFTDLGGADPRTNETRTSVSNTGTRELASTVSVPNSQKSVKTESLPFCSCSVESDWCSHGMCSDIHHDCIATDEECGTLWCYTCDGLCEQ
jgi:hypothetical protein